MSIEYKTAKQIYYSVNVRGKLVKDHQFFNIYAKFMTNVDQNKIIILEDFTLDCNFHIVVTDHIYEQFKAYFEPWYIFRFNQLKLTTFNPNYNLNQPKKLYLKTDNIESIVIFNLIEKSNERFYFHLSSTEPRIDESDWQIIKNLRQKFAFNELPTIGELKDKYKEGVEKNNAFELKWRQKLVFISLVAQIVEVNDIKFNQIVVKVFDGTIPKFKVTHPINRSIEQSVELNGTSANLLYKKSKDKLIYVLINGEHFVRQFDGKRPGDLVLFYNARMLETTGEFPHFRIDLNSTYYSEIKQQIKFFDANSNLGQFLMKRIDPDYNLNTPILNDSDNRSTSTALSTGHSFIHFDLLLNQISSPIYDFTHIKESDRNYQIYCTILDLYPLDHTALDLIRMRCLKCDLDGSINNLFSFDLKGICEAANTYYAQYQKNENMQCPNCSEESCSFYFQIIFYLQDTTGIEHEQHRMFAVLNENDADFYFGVDAIEVVANNKDEQFNLMRKINFIKQKFSTSRFDGTCHLVVRPDQENDLYTIKTIFIDID